MHTYAARELYTARLTVSDGAATTTEAITITVGSPVVATITQPPESILSRLNQERGCGEEDTSESAGGEILP